MKFKTFLKKYNTDYIPPALMGGVIDVYKVLYCEKSTGAGMTQHLLSKENPHPTILIMPDADGVKSKEKENKYNNKMKAALYLYGGSSNHPSEMLKALHQGKNVVITRAMFQKYFNTNEKIKEFLSNCPSDTLLAFDEIDKIVSSRNYTNADNLLTPIAEALLPTQKVVAITATPIHPEPTDDDFFIIFKKHNPVHVNFVPENIKQQDVHCHFNDLHLLIEKAINALNEGRKVYIRLRTYNEIMTVIKNMTEGKHKCIEMDDIHIIAGAKVGKQLSIRTPLPQNNKEDCKLIIGTNAMDTCVSYNDPNALYLCKATRMNGGEVMQFFGRDRTQQAEKHIFYNSLSMGEWANKNENYYNLNGKGDGFNGTMIDELKHLTRCAKYEGITNDLKIYTLKQKFKKNKSKYKEALKKILKRV